MATTKKTVKKFGRTESIVQIVRDNDIDLKAMEIPGVGCIAMTENGVAFIPGSKIVEIYSNGKVTGREIVHMRSV